MKQNDMQSTKYSISDFKSAIKSSISLNQIMEEYLFDNIPNFQFYLPRLKDFRTALKNEEENITVELRPIYYNFNNALGNLLEDTINLFFLINNHSSDITKSELEATGHYSNLLLDLKIIDKSVQEIHYNILKENISLAVKLKQYFEFFFNAAISKLKDEFFIDILSSPLRDLFIEVKQNIQNSINLEEIKIIDKKSTINKNTIHITKSNSEIAVTLSGHLEKIEENLTEENYKLLSDQLYLFFSENITSYQKKIIFKKVSMKKVGWILNEMYRELKPKTQLSIDYLIFIKQNIALFSEYEINLDNPRTSKIYKYLTQKPK